MPQMGEQSSLSAYARRFLDGAIEMKVGGMGTAAKSVQNQDVEVTEQLITGIRDPTDVGQVGKAAEAVAQNRHVPMEERDGNDAAPEQIEGVLNHSRVDGRFGAPHLNLFENVPEGARDRLERLGRPIDRYRALLTPVVETKIVEPQHVVRVRMGVQDSVHASDPMAKPLLPEVGGGVQKDTRALPLEQDRRSKALVAGVRRSANNAIAGEHRDARGRAGSEEGDAHRSGRLEARSGQGNHQISVALPKACAFTKHESRRDCPGVLHHVSFRP